MESGLDPDWAGGRRGLERLMLTPLSVRTGHGARSSLWMNRVLDAVWLMAAPTAAICG